MPAGDGTGYLVFELENPDTYDSETLRQSYTDDGSALTLTGDAADVGLAEVVTPDADEIDDASGASAIPVAGAKAPATGVVDAPVVDADSVALKAKEIAVALASSITE